MDCSTCRDMSSYLYEYCALQHQYTQVRNAPWIISCTKKARLDNISDLPVEQEGLMNDTYKLRPTFIYVIASLEASIEPFFS